MGRFKFSVNQIMAAAAFFITAAVYIAERALKRFAPWSEELALVQAIACAVLCFVVYLLIVKSKDAYLGTISALFAVKMLPPELVMLKKFNFDAYFIYYIFSKFAVALFLFAVYQLYKGQKVKEIRPIPVFALLVIPPFAAEVAEVTAKYAYCKTDSMMLPYAAQAGFYILAMAVLALIALIAGGKNGTLIADFSIICCVINMARKAFSALVLTYANMHVSKSYICWIIIFAAFIVLFALVRKKSSQKALNEII